MEYFILIAGWTIFCVLHSVLAAEKSKAFFAAKMGRSFKYYRLIYSLLSVVTLGAVLAWQFSIPGIYFSVSPFLKYFIALPCGVFAVVVMAICIRKYFFKLSGIEVLYHSPGAQVLETRGVHKFVRHPLYAGTLLMIWSMLLWFPTLANLLGCVMITVYVWIGIFIEERRLVRNFGHQYKDYQRNTPMLFPSIRLHRPDERHRN